MDCLDYRGPSVCLWIMTKTISIIAKMNMKTPAATGLVVADHAWRDTHVMREVRLRDPQLLPPFPHRLPWLLGEGDLPRDFFAQRELHGASEKASDI